MSHRTTDYLLSLIRDGRRMTLKQQLQLTAYLSFPSVIAQLSSIAMQYIDASMVGSLGAEPAASIGLVSTSTWLFWGMCSSASAGFTVQVAHRIGAKDFKGARQVFREAITMSLIFSTVLALIGVAIAPALPHWLGGSESICHDATLYFLVFALALPVLQLDYIASGMLRCSGNMKVPSILNVMMCVLDVIFNFLLIFDTHYYNICGIDISIPGANLGVLGAILGTVLAEVVITAIMMWYACVKSPMLRLSQELGSYKPTRLILDKAIKIGTPMGFEHFAICMAQIMTTVIVAPLGVFAIAANSFAIVAESLCYMPGYGIAEAATTLVGQSHGAGRHRLLKSFANITVVSGMVIMGGMGILMYIFAPEIIGVMTPVQDIRELGIMALRIEAFAEPMFAAAIVSYGVFVGMGKTFVPCLMNLGSIWAVRLVLAAILAPTLGLKGVWIAMCIELCFRGAIFLIRLWFGKWANVKSEKTLG